MRNWGKSVNAVMQIPRKTKGAKALRLRNAYGLNPAKEYNARTSPRHPNGMKIYAELGQKKKVKKLGIKSLSDNRAGAAQVDSSTTTLTMSAMQTLYHNCVLNNMQPSVAVGTKANYNRYYALLQPQQRFVDTNSAKAGWTTLMFNGIPFIADTSCPANHLFFLNEEQLHLIVHPECDMKFTGFKDPTNQDAEVAQILWFGAFASSNNRCHGKFSALTA